MKYPKTDRVGQLADHLKFLAALKAEHGATGIAALLGRVERDLARAVADLDRLPGDRARREAEPDGLRAIRALRPAGPRRMWGRFEPTAYAERLKGALLARMAGCTLGAPVEGYQISDMRDLAEVNGDAFPPVDYWSRVPFPKSLRYFFSRLEDFTRGKMNGVPVDDDIAYTLLGLLVVEDHGPGFTIDQLGESWLKYVPVACTAEDVALRNLKKGVPAGRAGAKGNPFSNWIGADIRSDPWAYMAPGWPEKAAEMAWRDAMLTHRRTGLHGAMYFAATIAAAFAVDDPMEALRLGLTEIPARCWLAREIRWALKVAPEIRNHRDARAAVDERFPGMHAVHTVNNACLTVWGVSIGNGDVTRTLSETVAMGLDNDCTAATAGSIVGAVAGAASVPDHWHRPFNDTVWSYLNGRRKFAISGLLRRFARQARAVHAG